MELVGASPFVEFFDPVPSGGLSSLPPPPYLNLPKPYDRVLDMNIERQSIVYEVVLNRDIGFQIVEGPDGLPMVGEVTPGSKSEKFGVLKGDYITSTSATAGDSLWTHNTADGVKSAITTRFVMSSSVTVRFERPLSAIPKEIQEKIHVPYQYVVRVKRPIGIHVIEAALPYDPEKEENGRAVLVQYLKPELGAARSKRIEIGDQIIAMSASWGDRLWAVNSVESFVVGVKMRTDKQLSFKLRRMVPLEVYSGQLQGRLQRAEKKKINSKETSLAVSSGAVEDIHLLRESSSIKIADVVDRLTNASSLQALWKFVREADGGKMLSSYNVNKLMSAALRLERPDLAAQIFEVSFGFFFDPVANPAKALMKVINDGAPVSFRRTPIYENEPMLAVPLTPNNFVATTAVKAYGRLKEPRKALAILPWLESGGARGAGVEPDVYFMSALLYVCAKEKMVSPLFSRLSSTSIHGLANFLFCR